MLIQSTEIDNQMLKELRVAYNRYKYFKYYPSRDEELSPEDFEMELIKNNGRLSIVDIVFKTEDATVRLLFKYNITLERLEEVIKVYPDSEAMHKHIYETTPANEFTVSNTEFFEVVQYGSIVEKDPTRGFMMQIHRACTPLAFMERLKNCGEADFEDAFTDILETRWITLEEFFSEYANEYTLQDLEVALGKK